MSKIVGLCQIGTKQQTWGKVKENGYDHLWLGCNMEVLLACIVSIKFQTLGFFLVGDNPPHYERKLSIKL